MMQCRSLVTFNTPYGFVRTGERLWVEPTYFAEANKKIKQLELIKPQMEPSRRQSIPGAPFEKKERTTEQSPPLSQPPPARDEPPDAGREKPAASSRAALH